MARQIGQNSYRLDLNLFVASRKQEIFEGTVNFLAQVICEKWVLSCVVIQDVRHTADCIQNEFLILFNVSPIDSLAHSGNKLRKHIFHGFEGIQCHCLLSGQVGQQLNHLGEGVFQMTRREFLILGILLFRFLGCLLLSILSRLVFVFLEIEDGKLHDCEKTRLFIVAVILAKLLSGFLEIGCQVTKDVRKTDQDGRAFLVLHHRLEIALHVATFDDFFSAAVIK